MNCLIMMKLTGPKGAHAADQLDWTLGRCPGDVTTELAINWKFYHPPGYPVGYFNGTGTRTSVVDKLTTLEQKAEVQQLCSGRFPQTDISVKQRIRKKPGIHWQLCLNPVMANGFPFGLPIMY